MTDNIFKDMAKQMRPSPEAHQDLLARIDADSVSPQTESAAPVPPPRRWVRWLVPAVAAVTVASLIGVGVSGRWSINFGGTTNTAGQRVADYGTLYAAVRAAPELPQMLIGASMEDQSSPKREAAAGSWTTNAQVRAIDEGDLVKSDGRNIFVASGKQVSVVAAGGDGTRVLSRIDTSTGEAGKTTGHGSTIQGSVVDLILRGTTLVVLVTEYQPRSSGLPTRGPLGSGTMKVPFGASLTKALIYDVSDPAVPRYQGSLGQSGGLVTTRLADNVLYLVTAYAIVDQKAITQSDPKTFVPVLTQNQVVTASLPDDCGIMPTPNGPTYAVVSSIDLDKRSRIDTESVLGGADTVYMSQNNLYLAALDMSASKAVAQKAGVPKGISGAAVTNLARISVNAGQLALAAQGSLPGQVLDQFSLDEWDGHLRVATTMEGENAHHKWVLRASLWVLDADLEVAGSIPTLAKGESVRSVRFDGALGYVVTFRSIDPLFAVDMTDATAPRVLSALKIPGFSSYLHPWADGRLFGFGQDVTTTGDQRGLKLSMFDTSRPAAVTELTSLRIKADDSEALTDHRAVLVDAPAGLVGFPVTSWSSDKVFYELYRYDSASGFALVGRVKLPDSLDQGVLAVRGLTIDGNVYLTSERSVIVYRLAGFVQVAKVSLGE